MALGKRKRQAGKVKLGRAKTEEGGRVRASGWLPKAFLMGVSCPVHLLTDRLLSSRDVGRLLLPARMISDDGILPLMLRRDEMEAMGGSSGLKVRAFDAAGLEYDMYLKNDHKASCFQLVGPQCRALINNTLLVPGARRRDVLVTVWAFRANTPGWRYRSPDEDPLWFARDLCLAITANASSDANASDAVRASSGPPIDGWRGVRPKPRSSRRRRRRRMIAPTTTGLITAATISPFTGLIRRRRRRRRSSSNLIFSTSARAML